MKWCRRSSRRRSCHTPRRKEVSWWRWRTEFFLFTMETRRRAHSDKELINQYIGVLQTLDEFCAPVALLPARQTVIATAILAEATKKSPAYEREALKIYFVWLAAF